MQLFSASFCAKTQQKMVLNVKTGESLAFKIAFVTVVSEYLDIPVTDVKISNVRPMITLSFMRSLQSQTENSIVTYILPSNSVVNTVTDLQEMIASGSMTLFLASNGYSVTATTDPTIVSVQTNINSQNSNKESSNAIPSPLFPNSVPILAGGGGGLLILCLIVTIYICSNRKKKNV